MQPTFPEILDLAQDQDGLVSAQQARSAGISDSVLSRLVQRGKLERVARGVFRVPILSPDRFAELREAVLWAKANRGPQEVAISHESALVLFGISDANPATTHLSIPKSARLRRRPQPRIELHRTILTPGEIVMEEGIPVTTVERTVNDLLEAGARLDLIGQAVSGARRKGLINEAKTKQLRRRIEKHSRSLRSET